MSKCSLYESCRHRIVTRSRSKYCFSLSHPGIFNEPLTGLPKQIYNYYVLFRSRDRGFDVRIRRLARFTKS